MFSQIVTRQKNNESKRKWGYRHQNRFPETRVGLHSELPYYVHPLVRSCGLPDVFNP